MTLGFALVAAFLFLAWLTDRTILLWPAFFLGLVLCSGLSLSGHSAVDVGSSWKSELADYVHLVAACFWVGGLVMLAFVVWPTAPELRRDAFHRFSQLAAVLVGAMVLAGAYLAYDRLPEGRRSLAGPLRAGAADQELARRARTVVGRAAPLRRGTGAGTRPRSRVASGRTQPARRERGRDRDPPRGRCARRCEPTGEVRKAAGSNVSCKAVDQSGWPDSNRRLLRPKRSTLTRLSYTPKAPAV